MTGKEYLKKLERRLKKLPQDEREDAMAYYREYFADAGLANEQSVIASLGSPAQIAVGIYADYAERDCADGTPRVKKGISAVWLAILGIFAAPIALPIAIVIFAVVFTVFVVILSVFLSLFVTSIALFASGIASVIMGLLVLPQGFSVTLFYAGGGLAVSGIGLLVGYLTVLITKVTLRGIARMLGSIRHGKTGRRSKGIGWQYDRPYRSASAVQADKQKEEEVADHE